MRKNILPHFLNRDAREIIKFDAIASRQGQERVLEDALRVAVLLSETAAIIPPGHFLESDLAFEVITNNSGLLNVGLVEMPLRETNLVDLIEKKRSEYGSVRRRFPGLFDDRRMRLFERIRPYFRPRRTRIGQEATRNWERGPDTSPDWGEVKKEYSPGAVDVLRRSPQRLLTSGEALTWPALLPHLSKEIRAAPLPARVALQKNYFDLYIREYNAAMLSDLPYGFDVYISAADDSFYSYRNLLNVLQVLELPWFPRTTVDNVVQLKLSAGWIGFADAFIQMQAWTETPTTVVAAFSRAARDVRWQARAYDAAGQEAMAGQAEGINAIRELAEALGAVASRVSTEYALEIRAAGAAPSRVPVPRASREVVNGLGGRAGASRPIKCVFVATSNEREARAVRRALLDYVGSEQAIKFVTAAQVPRFSATMATKKGEVLVELGLAEETGGDEAVDLLRRYVSEAHPDAVFFVGCSGLLDEKQPHEENLVLVAKRAIDADQRKLTGAKVVYDGDLHHGDGRLRNMLAMLNSADAFAPVKLITNRDFISSSAFHQSRDSPERKALVSEYPPDAVVIEMEAFAVYKELARMRARGVDIGILVVKGISDVGDENAQTGKQESQYRASLNAANVVLKLLYEIGG